MNQPVTGKIKKFDVAAQVDGKVLILIALDNGYGHKFAISTSDAKNIANALTRQADIAIAYQQKN